MNNKIGYNMVAGGNNRKRRQEVTDRIAEKIDILLQKHCGKCQLHLLEGNILLT